MNDLIYLASPYTHASKSVMSERIENVNKIAAKLIQQGKIVFSPLTHNVTLQKYGVPSGWDSWKKFNRLMMRNCSNVLVLKQKGWDKSIGVQNEIVLAKKLGLTITYVDVD